ncbi:MAG TPA: hypothetical protein VF476_07840 [Chitinophagaceae bacterium]
METAVILLFGMLSAIGAFISATHKMVDSSKKGIKKITGSGWIFILCAGFLIVLPVIQKSLSDRAQQNDQNKRDASRMDDQDKRDSIMRDNYNASILAMKKEYDKSSKTSTATITEVLAKYGYKFDSVNMALVKLKELGNQSLENPVLVIPTSPNPGINVLGKRPSDNYDSIEIRIQSKDAGSSYFDIRYGVVADDGKELFYAEKASSKVLHYNSKIWRDAYTLSWIFVNNIERATRMYVWARGNYKRLDGTGIFYMDEVICYDVKTKFVSTLKEGDESKRVKDVVNKAIKK